ncbi:MAG: RNA methyltransferase [Sulfolobus sp.]|nr:RNA methyltransferase [Sulfolobus sp.]
MIRVILVEPEGAYNTGFVARLCKNFSVDELYLVNPKFNINEAMNFSAHGREYLEKAVIVNSYERALEGLDIKIATSSIADNKGDILRKSIKPWELVNFITEDKKIGLIFGRESVGLTREEIVRADFLLYIPANPIYPVLNLSHAVGIVLYELWRNKELKIYSSKNVSAEAYQLLDKYSKMLYDLISRSPQEIGMYIALKRALMKGVSDEEEARTIIRFLRRLYTRIIHEEE